MDIEIKIVRNNAVLVMLNDKDFISQWKQLADGDEKATIIQEPPFVTTWYKQYKDKYEPVLILGYDRNACLVGLMPVAFHLKKKYLTHAGDNQAEYHGWLCRKSDDIDFLLQALIAIRDNFKLKYWKWNSIPPRSDLSWLKSDIFKSQKIYINFYSEDSPILDLKDEVKLNNLKKNLTNKINRYKRRGNFYFERIKSKEKAFGVFDILAKQCDFRQMAAYGKMPFTNDRNKKNFFIERLDYPENNHFTILWSNDNIIAYHFGPCDSDTVYLGLTGYNPVEEKNSPGSILIVMLAEFLRNEGYRYLDLTVGGNYKEKYCNLHQKLYMPTIYFSRKGKIIADYKLFLRNTGKYIISKIGGQPEVLSGKLKDFTKSVKIIFNSKPSVITRNLISSFYDKKVYIVYKLDIDNYSMIDHNHPVRINKYPDLLLSADPNSSYKKELLKNALRHFCQEDLLYTVVLDGVLAQYGWMTRGGACQKPPDEIMQFDTPVNSYILYDFFTEKNFKKELLHDILGHMIDECRTKGAAEAYIPVNEINISERNLIQESGFKMHHKFIKTRTLGFVKTREN
jgi:hypothetical protein